ncbi:hypothetical protein PIB30_027130 [Stylosanthes scabra]|uniref:Uncharacterized protein n=1 Tax=Stylosanthes scabra TaxID=79078 RepID=A0ABU6XC26_9FABA|nr:hypothetical protein [Stylosanthes scabra]
MNRDAVVDGFPQEDLQFWWKPELLEGRPDPLLLALCRKLLNRRVEEGEADLVARSNCVAISFSWSPVSKPRVLKNVNLSSRMIFQSKPFSNTFLLSSKLLQAHEGLLAIGDLMKSDWWKYLPLKILLIRELGLDKILQACLANIAKLKALRSLKSSPPMHSIFANNILADPM